MQEKGATEPLRVRAALPADADAICGVDNSGIAEFSVYVAPLARRQGAGRRAMQALLQAADGAGRKQLTFSAACGIVIS